MSDINCPYCDAELEVNHDDGFGYEEDVQHTMECSECEKNFVFTTQITFDYTPSKADCLNGENHKYKPTHTSPKCFTKMRCKTCNLEKDLTDDDRKQFGIGTIKEYIDSLRAD